MEPDRNLNLALRYLARSPKTVVEMRRYLARKSLSLEEIDAVIDRLLEFNYLNDHNYARQFIDNRIRFKPKSAYALGYELRNKGVDPLIFNEFLDDLDDTELALAAARSKQGQWRHLDPETRKKKLMNHLRYRGFDFIVCNAVWERLLMET